MKFPTWKPSEHFQNMNTYKKEFNFWNHHKAFSSTTVTLSVHRPIFYKTKNSWLNVHLSIGRKTDTIHIFYASCHTGMMYVYMYGIVHCGNKILHYRLVLFAKVLWAYSSSSRSSRLRCLILWRTSLGIWSYAYKILKVNFHCEKKRKKT